MEPTFRGSMNWLHTWAGVVLGGLLFAIFWMGSLSVFDREIDRWMIPSTRLALSPEPISFDALRPTIDEAAAGRSAFWAALLDQAALDQHGRGDAGIGFVADDIEPFADRGVGHDQREAALTPLDYRGYATGSRQVKYNCK